MKKIAIVLVLLSGCFIASAQKETGEPDEQKGRFKKENLFTGGGVTVSFSNYTTVLGASPMLGYSINRWIDAGIIFNFNYISNRHVTYFVSFPPPGYYFTSDDKLRQTVFGPGVFARVYPINFLFVQAQAEQNFIKQKLIFDNGAPTQKESLSATSLLVGAGYCNGREGTGSLFYYLSVMVDVAKDRNSPYLEETSSGRLNILPIIRAGLQVPLFQGKRNRF
jgi:hypothetical protein